LTSTYPGKTIKPGYKKIKNIGIIAKIKYSLSPQNLTNLYYSLIFSYLSYCSVV